MDFHSFGLSHCTALLVTAAAAIFMVRLNRSTRVPSRTKQMANRALAAVLVISVLMDPLLTWLRYRADPDYALRLVREDALPVHLCDVVAIVLAWALITRNHRLAEVGYLWGLAGTVQGLITPTVKFDWYAPEYFAFFAQHGGVPVAALTLAFGAGLPPQRGALFRTMCWSWVYMAGVFVLNAALRANYGFINGPPEVSSLIDFMGPWPWYLLTLQAVAILLFALLLLPFRRKWRTEQIRPLSG